MDELILRSTRNKPPSTKLCIQAFARDLKLSLLGYIGDQPDYMKVADKIIECGYDLSKTTWSQWWNGNSMPSPEAQALIENKHPGLVSSWLKFNSSHRLQIHLFAVDVQWITEEQSKKTAFDSATAILETLHEEWRPNPAGFIYLPASKELEGKDWYNEHFLSQRANSLCNEPKQNMSIGLLKGPRSPLSCRVSESTRLKYHAINPTSILLYMISYAIESKLPDPGLKLAFALDFLTCIIATITIMHIKTPGRIRDNGELAQICLAFRDFFWRKDANINSRNYILNNNFTRKVSPILDRNIETYDFSTTWNLMEELKAIYYDSLKVTGLSKEELMDQMGKEL